MRSIKLFTCISVLFLFSLPFFAENTSVHTLHLSFPFEFRTLKITNSHSRKYFDFDSECKSNLFGVCANWNRLIFKENGLSFLFGIELGFTAGKFPDISSDFFSGGLFNSIAGKFGIGFAPLQNEKYILAFHGFSELNARLLDCNTKYAVGNSSDNLHYTVFEGNLVMGIDAVFLFKMGQIVSLFSGIDVSTIVIGNGSLTAERDSGMDFKEVTYKNYFNGINIVPRLGLCWGL